MIKPMQSGLILTSALVVLSACGRGGGGGEDGGASDPTQDPLFIAATDDSASGNGLPFAEEGALIIITGVDVDVPLLTAPVSEIRAPAEPTVTASTFAGPLAFFLGGDATFDIDIDGETVTIVDGLGTLGDGRVVDAARLLSSGGAQLVGAGLRTGDAYESISIFGFVQETRPSDIAMRAGPATYTGPFQFLTASYIDTMFIEVGTQQAFVEIGTQLDGTATLQVDFSSASLTGDVSGISFGAGEGTLNGVIAPMDIIGNGGIGTIAWSCAGGATCSDESDVGLVFGRSDASTILGLTSIDTDLTLGGGASGGLTGVGGFIVER